MSEHDHALGMEETADQLGRPVDIRLLNDFMGAAFDGCRPCQETKMPLIAADPVTCARLVEVACVAVNARFGGLPASLTDQDAYGQASPQFRTLAASGIGGENEAMFALCASMSPDDRRAAAESAADIVVGELFMSSAADEQS